MTLLKGNTELSRDPRPITSVWFDSGHGWSVGERCTKIEAYDENGEMANVPWLAVHNPDGTIVARIPARMVTVLYV